MTLRDVLLQLVARVRAMAFTPCLTRDEADDGLALQLVGPPDDRGLGDGRVRDERALDFRRAEPVAGDVEHVVDAAHDPEVSVLVAARAVAGEVACLCTRSSRSSCSAPCRRRSSRSIDGHGLRMTSLPPSFGGTSLPSSSTTAASTPKNGSVAVPGLVGVAPGSGVIMWPPVSVCHQVSTIGQRPPPMTL